MTKTLIVACAVAGGLFAVLAATAPAQAVPSVNLGIEKNADTLTPVARRGGGRGFRGGGRGFRGRGARVRSFRRGRGARVRSFRRGRGYRRGRVAGYRRYRKRRFRRFRRYYYGGPVVYGYYYYGGACAWLRRRAYATGSPYWWNRYYRCVDAYY